MNYSMTCKCCSTTLDHLSCPEKPLEQEREYAVKGAGLYRFNQIQQRAPSLENISFKAQAVHPVPDDHKNPAKTRQRYLHSMPAASAPLMSGNNANCEWC